MILPYPPTDREKYSYLNPAKIPFFISGLIGLSVFLLTTYWFISKTWWLAIYGIFCVLYFANVGFVTFGSLFAKKFDYKTHVKLRDAILPYYKPSVDIYLPVCGESLELLDNTFRYTSKIRYDRKIVWVLDDVGDEKVKTLADKYNFNYIARPNRGELKKSGNMRYAFKQSYGDLIVVFDADFAPRSDFLEETIFYFSIHSNVAILQTPQFFRILKNQVLIEKGATYLQEVFHRIIQNFRNTWGASVCTGSCAIYRRKALEPHGGSYPVERSEDVNTGLAVLRDGWEIKYLPLNLSCGLSPDTIKSFFNQHYRWCSGSIVLVTSKLFWKKSKIGILGKLSYLLSILYYTTSGTGTILFSIPTLLNIWFYPEDFKIANYSLILPAFVMVTLTRALWARSQWGASPLVTTYCASYVHLTSLIDIIRSDIAPWIPTGSKGVPKAFDRFKKYLLFIPLAQLLVLISGLIINSKVIHYRSIIFILIWFSLQIAMQLKIFQILKSET